MEGRDEEFESSKTVRNLNWEIGRKKSVNKIGENLNRIVREDAKKVMQNNCEHSLVLLLRASGDRTAYYCVSCGKVEYTQNLTKGVKKPYNYGHSIDFSENLCSNFLDIENSMVVKAVERLITDSAESSTDLTIPEFIDTIPESLRVSPEAIKAVLKEKTITKE
jgi:hypothetical protein